MCRLLLGFDHGPDQHGGPVRVEDAAHAGLEQLRGGLLGGAFALAALLNHLIDEVGLRQKIDNLKDGVQSRFGKEYDENGIEMSGGEGQKIAIARALYKESSLVILDEPDSA